MNKTPVTVRAITADDLAGIDFAATPNDASFGSDSLRRAEADDFYFLGGFDGSVLRGYVVLDATDETALRPEMRDLFVFPEYRRAGVGAALTKALEEIAARQGYDEVLLSVDPENPAAIPLYISLEYSPTGDHRQIDRPTGQTTEAIYRKSLRLH